MRITPGRRYGGSSSVNADASPFSTVFDSAHDTASVNATPISTTSSTVPACCRRRERREERRRRRKSSRA
jgi:hypothetical protein